MPAFEGRQSSSVLHPSLPPRCEVKPRLATEADGACLQLRRRESDELTSAPEMPAAAPSPCFAEWVASESLLSMRSHVLGDTAPSGAGASASADGCDQNQRRWYSRAHAALRRLRKSYGPTLKVGVRAGSRPVLAMSRRHLSWIAGSWRGRSRCRPLTRAWRPPRARPRRRPPRRLKERRPCRLSSARASRRTLR